MAGLINSAMGAGPDDPTAGAGAPAGLPPPAGPAMGAAQGAGAGMGSDDDSGQDDGQQDDGQDDADDNSKADPNAVKVVIILAVKALYHDGAINAALDAIQSAPSPAKGLADSTWDLFQHLDDSSGGKIPLQALAPAASEILGMIADSAAKKGLPVHGKEIAIATQSLVLRLMSMAGMDTSQMQQSISQVNYDQVGAMIDKQLANGGGQ
ncbi:hypothetical protein [Undibacterium sp.]|uniref:hypothetical protein n=1 Tax=Undibacterium sp. TaxID=1914977 RepID=UPI00374DF791